MPRSLQQRFCAILFATALALCAMPAVEAVHAACAHDVCDTGADGHPCPLCQLLTLASQTGALVASTPECPALVCRHTVRVPSVRHIGMQRTARASNRAPPA